MRPPRRILLAVLVLLFSVLAVQTAAATGGEGEGPQTLEGENFLTGLEGVTFTFDCHPDGISTVSYSATGLATGPYPGPFTVQGTVTIGPQTADPGGQVPGTLAGPILDLHETFTISSDLPAATISGTKTHQPGQDISQSQGTCEHVTGLDVGDLVNGSGTVVEVATQPLYEATIKEPGDKERIRGEAQLSMSDIHLTGSCMTLTCTLDTGSFSQGFLSSEERKPDDDKKDD
jgi:hypothetical protein